MSATATVEFKCVCGFETTSKSGLTNHKKSCVKSAATIQSPPPVETPMPLAAPIAASAPAIPNQFVGERISAPERQAYCRRVIDRKKAIFKALESEIAGDPEKVKESLRLKAGLVMTAEQINELIEGVDRQIDLEIQPRIDEEEEQLKIQDAELDEAQEKAEAEMKARHREEYTTLIKGFKEKKNKIKNERKTVRTKVLDEYASDLIDRKASYQLQLLKAREIEKKIEFESAANVAMLNKSKGRVTGAVEDAVNRAQEELLTARTIEEACQILNRIPTVAETIDMCQTVEGFTKLMRQLNPHMALPGPIQEVHVDDLSRVKNDLLQKIAEDNGEDDDEDEDEDTDDHDEIYDEDEDDEDDNSSSRYRRR